MDVNCVEYRLCKALSELADAELMLRSMDWCHWHYCSTPTSWVWRRQKGHPSRFVVPRTGPTPEISDEVRAAMLADTGGE